eukprot:1140783-Pelagomonas_calceolata.AAC.7
MRPLPSVCCIPWHSNVANMLSHVEGSSFLCPSSFLTLPEVSLLKDVPIPPKRTFQQRSGQQAGMGASSGASPQRPSWLPSLPSTGGGRGGGSSSAGQGLGVQVAAPRDTNLAATQAAVFAGA